MSSKSEKISKSIRKKEKKLGKLVELYENLELTIDALNEEIESEKNTLQYIGIKPCDMSYYEIRQGMCLDGDVYYGRIHCNNPNCTSK